MRGFLGGLGVQGLGVHKVHIRRRGVLLALLTLLAALASVQRGLADQSSAELPVLFAELQRAGNAQTARDIETRIWRIWLDTEDEKSETLMRDILGFMEEGDLRSALLSCNQLLDHDPEFAEAWNKRATVHYLMGNFNSSVRDIHRTLQLEARHFGAMSGLGLIFLRQGNLTAALEAFENVLQISPQSQNAQRSVAQVRGQIGEEI